MCELHVRKANAKTLKTKKEKKQLVFRNELKIYLIYNMGVLIKLINVT